MMRFPLFNSFFKKRENTTKTSESTLVSKLQSLTSQSNLLVFENIEIYHHSTSSIVPLMAFDPLRGIYIFEYKSWSFNDLENAQIQNAKHQSPSEKTLAFDKTRTLINQKFNELTHKDSLPVYNFALFGELDSTEYHKLNDSIKEHLPFERLIFRDYENSDIFQTLQKIQEYDNRDYPKEKVLTTLFVQYTFIETPTLAHFANSEQRAFLDSELPSLSSLDGAPSSGKSTLLLLKSIMMLMRDSSLKILILKPTLLSADLLKKKLLEIVERSIIEFNLHAIEIITPLELLNRHLEKLKKPTVQNIQEADISNIHQSFFLSDVVMCDDAHLLCDTFLKYIQESQKKSKLLLVNGKLSDSFVLAQQYKDDAHSYTFLQTNPYAKAILLARTLLKEAQEGDIIIVSSSDTREKFKEDLNEFLETEPRFVDATKNLLMQYKAPLLLATYSDINALSAKHIIILDISASNRDEVEYACNIATQSTHLLYTEECEEISKLKDRYASNQER